LKIKILCEIFKRIQKEGTNFLFFMQLKVIKIYKALSLHAVDEIIELLKTNP